MLCFNCLIRYVVILIITRNFFFFEIRNLLGYLLLAGEGTKEAFTASRCCSISVSECGNKEGLKSALEVLGGASVACNVIGNTAPRFSFPTCNCQCLNAPVVVTELQRYLAFSEFELI